MLTAGINTMGLGLNMVHLISFRLKYNTSLQHWQASSVSKPSHVQSTELCSCGGPSTASSTTTMAPTHSRANDAIDATSRYRFVGGGRSIAGG
jgi:hypothetical protein